MASEMPDNSQSLVDIDEFEGLEVTEIDGALLRDLLEELEEEEEEEAKNVTVESSEGSVGTNLMMNGCEWYEQIESGVHVNYLDWLDMMEMAPSLPTHEMIVWYEDACILENNGDYSQFYDGEGDETAYGFLWQDN